MKHGNDLTRITFAVLTLALQDWVQDFDATLRRVASWGDGWMPLSYGPGDEARAAFDRMRTFAVKRPVCAVRAVMTILSRPVRAAIRLGF